MTNLKSFLRYWSHSHSQFPRGQERIDSKSTEAFSLDTFNGLMNSSCTDKLRSWKNKIRSGCTPAGSLSTSRSHICDHQGSHNCLLCHPAIPYNNTNASLAGFSQTWGTCYSYLLLYSLSSGTCRWIHSSHKGCYRQDCPASANWLKGERSFRPAYAVKTVSNVSTLIVQIL